MSEPRIHILAPLSALRKRTRLSKIIPVLLERGYDIEFLGWERIPGEQAAHAWPDPRVTERRIFSGGGYGGAAARRRYPLWMAAVFWRVLTLGRRKTLYCLGWETAFPALLAARLTGSQILFDDADRFSLLLTLPAPLKQLVVLGEKWASRKALRHLVPGWSRYEWRHDGMRLLRNTPGTRDFRAAAVLAPPRPPADYILCANGWIGQSRGAPVFYALMQRLQQSHPGILMLAAGRLDCPAGQALTALPNVRFCGEIPADQALALCHISDAVLTFYDPAVPVNRQAESNKWGDCLFLGKLFLVNSEVETARDLVAAGFGRAVPYHDVAALEALVLRLAAGAEPGAAPRPSPELPASWLPFDEAVTRIFDEAGLPAPDPVQPAALPPGERRKTP